MAGCWALLALAAPAPGLAQSSDSEVLTVVRECQQVAGMSARLACYDGAFPPIAGQAAAPAAAGDTPAARALPAGQPLAREPVARTVETGTRAPRPVRAEQAPVVADDAIPTVAIVRVRTLRPRETIFYADDGRVFEQTGGSSRLRVPEPPFDAELESGVLGATFLRLPNDGPRVRVAERD